MKGFASDEANKEVDILFIVMMGHGGTIRDQSSRNNNKEYFITEDGYGFFVREGLQRFLDNKEYPWLIDKPKIALIQVCRGGRKMLYTDLYSMTCL